MFGAQINNSHHTDKLHSAAVIDRMGNEIAITPEMIDIACSLAEENVLDYAHLPFNTLKSLKNASFATIVDNQYYN